MKKIFILTLISICASITVCSAADIVVTPNTETGGVSVSGNPGAGNAEKKMMLYALKEGDTLAGLNPDETQKETDIFSAIEYCEADGEGNYNFTDIQMRSADGRYIFYVTADHSDVVYTSEPVYVTSKESAASMQNVFENKNAAEIAAALKENTVKLDAPVLNWVVDDAFLSKVAEKLANREYDTNDKLVTEVNKVSFETAMNNTVPASALEMLLYPQKYAVMEKYEALANSVNKMADKSQLSTFKYIEGMESGERAEVFASVSKTGYSGSDDMFDKINMAVIMTRIKGCSGYGNIKGILSDHRDVIEGFSYETYSASAYVNDLNKTLMTKTFTKTKELSDYIKTYLAGKVTTTGGTTGGGGGGGGGYTPFGNTSVNKKPDTPSPVIPPNPVLSDGEKNFNDIETVSWAKDAIMYLSEKGVISGKGDNRFAPQDNVKREEFVKMLVLAFDLKDDGEKATNFNDVNTDEWYAPYIKTAYNLGIVNGISDNSFGIGSCISRQDMAVMITRAKNVELDTSKSNSGFSDSDKIADYAGASIDYLKDKGAINGYADGTFRPHGNVTRAETAKVLYELLK